MVLLEKLNRKTSAVHDCSRLNCWWTHAENWSPQAPHSQEGQHLLCHHNTAPWKSHVICCLLSSGWNKIGEDWGVFKLLHWKTCLFQGECGAGSAAGKSSQRHPTHIPAHTQGAIHNMQTPWNPKQISRKSLVLQREQRGLPTHRINKLISVSIFPCKLWHYYCFSECKTSKNKWLVEEEWLWF